MCYFLVNKSYFEYNFMRPRFNINCLKATIEKYYSGFIGNAFHNIAVPAFMMTC